MKNTIMIAIMLMTVVLTVSCGDDNNNGKNNVKNPISAGEFHSCEIKSGKAYCWGGDYGNGNLGVGEIEESMIALPVNSEGVLKNKTLVAITAGDSVTCALDNNGNAYCWGWDDDGVLGDGTEEDKGSNVPVAVDTTGVLKNKKLVNISSGCQDTCALDDEGKAYCWGSKPIAIKDDGILQGKRITQLSVGEHYSLALDNEGSLYELNVYEEEKENVSLIDLNGKKLSYISPGNGANNDLCAIDDSQQVLCWNNGFDEEPSILNIETLKDKILISVNLGLGAACCVLDIEGRAYCWEDVSENLTPPVAIEGILKDKKITHISVGESHACAKDENNKSYCWGVSDDYDEGYSGQLGNGKKNAEEKFVPVEVVYSMEDVDETENDDEFYCVTALDCPRGMKCEDGMCVEDSGDTENSGDSAS